MTRPCKYCGVPVKQYEYTSRNICTKCTHKTTLLPQFAKARDNLRQKIGLPPLTNDTNTCSNVK